MHRRRRGLLPLVLGAVTALTACTGAPDRGPAVEGEVLVAIAGSFADGRAAALQQDLDAWGAERGIELRYSRTAGLGSAAAIRPSVVLLSGPSEAQSLAGAGATPLERLLDVAAVTADEPAGLADTGRSRGRTYALPLDVSVTSVVWYDPVAFERAALDVPDSDDALRRITGYVVDEDSGFPWCEGTRAGAATGRTLVDWLGEYVLQYGGLEQYRRWVRHDIPFDAPIARRAAQKVYGLLLKPQQVDGGGKAIATTAESDAGAALSVDGKAAGQCYMLHQQSAATDGYPARIAARIEADGPDSFAAFPLPTPSGATASASGTAAMVAAFDDDAATKAVVGYLAGRDFGVRGYRAAWPVTTSPHRRAPLPEKATPLQRASAAAIRSADAWGSDTSSALPAGTIAGSELTKWAENRKTIDAALAAVERAWPVD